MNVSLSSFLCFLWSPWSLCLLVMLVFVFGACAKTDVIRPSTPFTADDAQLFQQAVGRVAKPGELEGRWRDSYFRELEQRVARADVVAIVQVETLRVDTDPSGKVTYRVLPVEAEALRGTFPEELSLVARGSDLGFSSIAEKEDELLGGRYVVFIKWEAVAEEGGGEEVRAHWHLSPATDAVIEQVRSAL